MKFAAWSLLLVLVFASRARAQSEPHIGYVYPAGGRQGTTFEVTVGGRYLNTTGVEFSGSGISATIVKQERQVSPLEQSNMREALEKFRTKREQGQLSAADIKTAMDLRQKLINFGRRLTNPSLGEFITLQVTIAPQATPGNHEIRLRTQFGFSNPMLFQVGDLPEISKKDWKNVPKAQGSMDPEIDPKPPAKNITLPLTINGQIPPGGVDRYRFSAQAGQKIVVVVRARELIPFISDAVPGWFQSAVTLYDAKGQELAYTDDYQFHPDPVLFYKVPASGDYVLEIKDALYRGREDFVYRITLGELPFVTGVFPLGGQVGTPSTLAVTGWNTPFKQLPLDLREATPGIQTLAPERLANRVVVMADTLPECLEKEPNNTIATAQSVTLPIIINGHIDQPGDMDVFRFTGQAGAQVVAEVYARRLDSPLDSLLIISDAAGKQLAFNDDHEDKGSGLNTHYADSYIAYTLPATGSYFVHIGDTQHGGGPAYSYRLRLSAPRPDFSLRATPSTLNVRGGTSVPLTVHALRQDGFAGAITLRLKDAPPGFTLTGAQIPENQDKVQCTLDAPPVAHEPFNLHIEGTATIQSRPVVRAAVPAEDMMQAFAYRHLVPTQAQQVAVIGRAWPGVVNRLLSPMPLHIPAGATARVQIHLPTGPLLSKIQFELSDPPEGLTIKESSPTELVFQADPAKIKPGFKGNLVVTASGERTFASTTQSQPATARRLPLGAMPAIPFEVVPR